MIVMYFPPDQDPIEITVGEHEPLGVVIEEQLAKKGITFDERFLRLEPIIPFAAGESFDLSVVEGYTATPVSKREVIEEEGEQLHSLPGFRR